MKTALFALYAFVVLSGGGGSAIDPTPPHGCTVVSLTGEGFPVAHCADGSYAYQDLDGTDGSLGTVGDGRWVTLPKGVTR